MSINKRPLHFAHSEGHTDLCYTEDGRSIITCGSDGDIRIWDGIDDTDPDSHCVGEGAFSVAQKGEDIYVCRYDGRVSILSMEGQRNGTLTRFTASATHITVGKNQPIICCAGEDFAVKIFNSAQDAQCTEFSDLKGPALGVAISPKEDFIAASCGDGNVYIWDLKEKKLIKTIECVPRINSFTAATVLCRVSFNSKGNYFAYPHDKEIIIANTDNYEKIFCLKAENVDASFSVVAFSPCGNFIAATSTNGDICIWPCKPGSNAVSISHEHKYNICALVWHPEEMGEIVYCDVTGQIGSLEYIPNIENSLNADDIITDADLNMIPAEDRDADDDDDDENVISLDKIRNETLGGGGNSTGADSRADSIERANSPVYTLQAPFQPSSTPYHLQHRFMVYNEVGIVRLFKDEDSEMTGSTSIDVLFHDASFHKSLYMKNYLNHTMASLSTDALLLACETPSKLVCIPLKAGSKEWTIELTDLEEILCIGASSSLIAIASNVRMLRVFSIFGMQRTVISIPGPVVSIAAKNNYILVVYHACTAHSKDQHLSGMLIHLNEFNVTSKCMPIPITPQANLTWVGFTNVGSLATYDSAGILRISKLHSGVWIPSCDTTIHFKGVSDTFFIVSVNESSQNVQVVHCRGTMYPAASPLPLLHELPMQLPMCELSTDKTQLEDKVFRWSFFQTEKQDEKTYKEAIIKLFALACKNDLDDRAYEILEIVNKSSFVNLSIKYATKLGKHHLAEKMKKLAQQIDGDYTINDDTQNVSIKPVLHRMNRPKKQHESDKNKTPQTSQSVEQQTQPELTPDLFTNTTLNDTQTQSEPSPLKPKMNPFKKSISNENKRNPLSLTNTNDNDDYMEVTPTKNSSSSVSFETWFKDAKSDLEEKYPELSKTNLVKFAVRLFRKQAEKRKANDDGNEDENGENHTQHKNKQSKLSAFAFSKN